MKKILKKIQEYFENSRKDSNFNEMMKMYDIVDHYYDRIKSLVIKCFPLGSQVTELGTGRELHIESYDLDNLLLKVMDLEKGTHENFDFQNSIEWNTVFFNHKSKLK